MTTASPVAPVRTASPGGDVTQIKVLRSEWIKFRSLRSSWFSLLAAVVIVVALGTLFSAARANRFGRNGPVGANFDPTNISLRGVFLAQLAIGVLGVLAISGEYATGMIRSSLGAVPARVPVLVAKAVVVGVVAFVVTEISALLAFVFGQLALRSTHRQATLSGHDVWRAILGAGIYLTLIALIAVGLGFLVRSTAGAIASLFGVVLVLPLLAEALPDPYNTDVGKYLPLNAGTQILSTGAPDPAQFGPWAGIGLVAGYAVVALALGAIALKRRDA